MVSKVTCPLPIMTIIVRGLWQEIKAEVEGMCLSWHHCEGREGESSGTKAGFPCGEAPLLHHFWSLGWLMQKIFITVMTRKKMKAGIEPSLFTCPFLEQKISPNEGARSPGLTLLHPHSALSWCFAEAPALPAQGWWPLFQSDTGMGMAGHCWLPGEWTLDSPHTPQMLQFPDGPNPCRAEHTLNDPPASCSGSSKPEPGRAHPKVNKPGCHWFLALSLAKGSKRSIFVEQLLPPV